MNKLVVLSLLMLLLAACSGGTETAVTNPTHTPQPITQATTEATTEATATAPATAAPTHTPAPTATAAPLCTTLADLQTNPDELGWWNKRVFYEIFVRSFYDSNGDGIGDLNGIIEKLDYLNDGDPSTTDDLGITGIWLMPLNASPSYHGYDVTDYYTINPDYGTIEELKTLLDEAHARDIRIIVDLVLNHTSTEHPWFQEALSDPNSPYRDYYIFEEESPGFRSPWGSSVWHTAPGGGYYYGVFWSGMPDLNYTNPQVTADMQDVIRFWLEDVGVDGFRLDAIKHLIEDGRIQENTPATHEWWQGFYDYYTNINPDAFTVGEAWSATSEVVKYIGDEVNIAFEFDLAGSMIQTAKREASQFIIDDMTAIVQNFPPQQYGTFLTNHDQDRVMSQLLGEGGQAKSAASLLLTSPGVPFLYYGEEIGQRGRKPDEEIRAPMPWSGEAGGGFTTAVSPWQPFPSGFENINVAAATADPDSLLNHYRRLIQARNQNEALRLGDWQEMPTNNGKLYAFLRRTANQTLLVLINLGEEPITDYRFCLDDGGLSEGTAVEILKNSPTNAPTLTASGGFEAYTPIAKLEPYSTYIIELK
ncbi:MAG: alpha-amylase [Ardenticatenaceae bacterium]|nr:alpha-amylase [Ardenticatenaceae bacterium]